MCKPLVHIIGFREINLQGVGRILATSRLWATILAQPSPNHS
jgi:hypothetical protein